MPENAVLQGDFSVGDMKRLLVVNSSKSGMGTLNKKGATI